MHGKAIYMESANRTSVKVAYSKIAIISSFVLITAAISVSNNVLALEEVNGIFLFIDDYTNDSIVDAWAALNFTGAPIPPPSQVDDVLFEWFAPNGTKVFQQLVDPNDAAWAPCSYRVEVMGRWIVNVTYTTNTSVHDSLEFSVMPKIWGPGQVLLNYTTVIGRGGELTILPGTEIQFPISNAQYPNGGALRVQGKITAAGTISDPIVFTSASSTPAAGDWNRISFLETADNSSVISRAEIKYSNLGIKIINVSPKIENVTFINNRIENIRAEYSSAAIKDITITGGTYGIDLVGSDITVDTVTISDSDYCILLQDRGNIKNAVLSDCIRIGISDIGLTGKIENSVITNSEVGIRAQSSDLEIKEVTISGGQKAFDVVSSSNVLIENSSIEDIQLIHFAASDNSHIIAKNVELSPSNPIRRDIRDNSTLLLQNLLRVQANSYETGGGLAGVEVKIYDNGYLVGDVITGLTGITNSIFISYGTYNSTSFVENDTIILLNLPGYIFANNSRLVNMMESHTENFVGSIYDNDNDGNPDFNDTDDDNDGLTDNVEQQIGTDPFDGDTDDDGMPDGWEFVLGFNPNNPSDADGDIDGDGLSNKEEYDHQTDPQNPDSDSDRLPDGWEVLYGFDPLNSSDADGDEDGDGYSNLEEYQNGTDPRNPESKPEIPPTDLGPLGLGDYWPIVLVPLGALCLMVVFVTLTYIYAVPRRKRKKFVIEESFEEEIEED